MLKRVWMTVAVVAVSAPGAAQPVPSAQALPITSPAPNIIVPNYNGIPIGPLGGLEGSAYIARASDTSAPWFNPAGLTQAGTQLSGSVGNYQFTTVKEARLPDAGGSTQHLPNLVGGTKKWNGLTAGFALITTVSWATQLDTVHHLTNADGNSVRFGYDANSAMSQGVAVAAVAYDLWSKWRVGAGVALTSTSISSEQVISDRIDSPVGIRTLLFTSETVGSIETLRGIFGAQFQPTPMIRLGVVTRTSALRVAHNGSMSLDSTLDGGGPSVGASIHDPSPSFDYELPYELSGGLALVGKRGEVEFDIKGYSSIDPYALLSSEQPMTIYADPGDGSRGTIVERPFAPVMASARAVTNYTGGGHFQILETPFPLTVHAGIGTDNSPVPPEDDSVFAHANFMVYTAGVSGSRGKFSFAFGVNSRRGTVDNLLLKNLITGPVAASLTINTFGITYSLNYKF